MKSILLSLSIVFFTIGTLFSQNQPINKPTKGYRFQYRIKGPEFKKSEVLELMVDEYGNYLVATFRGEKSSYVYLIIYNLYSWDEKYKIKLDDNRCELYNSTFDESGDFFYVNYDIYRNMFKEINLKTGEIRKVDCSATPKGCRKIESQFYKLDAYTIGDNYYIYRDEKFENYIKILVKKEMYIPKVDEETVSANYGLKNALYVDPTNGGVIQVTPEDLRNLKAGIEVTKNGVPIFYDANAVDAAGNIVPYAPAEGEPFKIRFTTNEIKKLDKKISFVYQNFVIKLDLEALEAEKPKQ
ncbi:MAG TPA: hypothetical protein DCQ26_11780 [Marinilabiliales bacterium]|nr:MAG: hypothetical protein A2W95_18525 [Bacteroidetes bacterium GWA2_40_14]OFX62563.1 MAG: hypothetical protein A2W84_08490 [Bacteroidetes bacterium GWC2_40_13]OFX72645.1 MAG: hypothetical protein A2W96_01635 [Bacteroidetes bacterium GWD2_40_43]OFX91066.1 MAG: hypothetical protein A2W97_15600 [Bacteroidetes bacterium GWE2_40_63]OFY23593.1 MAG: hypothetical protein A2W88_05650 [Bacteroidetes bacterium GWF2_40_13]OFZ25804.1 MAG: hypothetical protein A2437_00130 [Bacteroidetes bacterium RIFOXYC